MNDPGVFSLSTTATGAAGTACAARTFTVTGPASDGRYTFTPIGGPFQLNLPGTPTATCRIDFTFSVLKLPTMDAVPATPGVQTLQELFVTGFVGDTPVFGEDLVDTTVVAAPVAVTFLSLFASASTSGVKVRWSTASEIQLAGFNVYRQVHGKRVRVNHRIIASASRSGHRYSFVDRSLWGSRAVGARYYIQAINLDGSRSWFGPARVLSGRAAS